MGWLCALCLRVFNKFLPWFQEEMTSALATMRVDYDQVKIKDLKTSNNRLLNKRRKKQKQAGTSSAAPGCNNQWEEKPRTCGWRVKIKRNNLKSVWSTQSVPQRQWDCEEAILQRGSSVKDYIFITWIKALLLKANVYDVILLHIAWESTAIPETLWGFVLALTVSDKRRGGSLSILTHWGFNSHLQD